MFWIAMVCRDIVGRSRSSSLTPIGGLSAFKQRQRERASADPAGLGDSYARGSYESKATSGKVR